MKTKYVLSALALLALPAAAQETYENAKIAQQDLNGTARYVGMGGAMEALGADISTISTNPAGIGLFRHSNASVSAGFVSQYNGHTFDGANKTNASFDQIGFVIATRSRSNSFVNFGFNYHKGRNFDYILNAANSLSNASQNKQSYIKNVIGDERKGGFYIDQNTDGTYIGYANAQSEYTAYTWSQIDYLYWNTVIPDAQNGGTPYYYDATGYNFDRKHTGYVGNYDFNISGNVNDRFYWGVTFGVKDVHYHGISQYGEDLIVHNGNDPVNAGNVGVYDDRKITGTGFDVTLGVIVRPVEESPFRFGLYVKTPTWYDLTTDNYTAIANNIESQYGGTYDTGRTYNSYDFKITTPWKFGVSLGHTVGNCLALGATYEYEDYGTLKTRVNDGVVYDYDYYWGGDAYESSHKDRVMNDHTKHTLKGVSTLKLGAEYKPISNLAVRVGYNYVSPVFEESGQKNPLLQSNGTSYQSSTDFVNWKGTNRVTFGVGYQIKKFNIDLAYQYSSQKGDFYPFSNTVGSYTDDAGNTTTVSNGATSTEVKNNRGQVLLTLGYQF